MAPGRCRAPTPARALPAGLALNPARLVLADQKEFSLLCTIYLGKTRWLALESPFQVRSRPRSQRRCAVEEKPPFVQKLSAPPPTPTHLHVSIVCVSQAGTAEDTSVPLNPGAPAQHQHCTENLPIPATAHKKPERALTELPGSCHSKNNTPASPEKRLGQGKGLGNQLPTVQCEHNLQFTYVFKVKMGGIKTLLTHRI